MQTIEGEIIITKSYLQEFQEVLIRTIWVWITDEGFFNGLKNEIDLHIGIEGFDVGGDQKPVWFYFEAFDAFYEVISIF